MRKIFSIMLVFVLVFTTISTLTYGATSAKLAPLSVPKIEVFRVSSDELRIDWTECSKVDGYEIYRANKNGKDFKKIKVINESDSLTYSDESVSSNTTYYYKVCSFKKIDKKTVRSKMSYSVWSKTYNEASSTLQVSKVSLNSSNEYLGTKETFQLKEKLSPNNPLSSDILWKTSNSKVATVNSKGLVKATGKGTCYIYAIAHNGIKDSCKINVYGTVNDVKKISLGRSKIYLKKGSQYTFDVTLSPEIYNGLKDEVTFSSSDKNIAKVSKTGKVTAVATGTAVITAKIGKRSKSCTVYVQTPEKYDSSYDLSYFQSLYEKTMPSIYIANHKRLDSLNEITPARYTLSNGVYSSTSVENDNSANIYLTGDMMCQINQQVAAFNGTTYDFNDNLSQVKDILSDGDFVIGNLETCLSETAAYRCEQPSADTKPYLNAPSTFLDSVKNAGFDAVVTANNHGCDTGLVGMKETLYNIDRYKLLHTGSFLRNEESRYMMVNISGIKVAFLSYAQYYNEKNYNFNKAGRDVLLNKYTEEKAEKDIAAAKADGAEYVIVYIHWGAEYVNIHGETQEEHAYELANAGADYIVGSHPHALQDYDIITNSDGKKVPVIYSMGNFVAYMDREVCKDSMILNLVLEKDAEGNVTLADESYIPCRIVFKDNDCSVMATQKEFNGGISNDELSSAEKRIASVLGNKIKMKGKK